MICIAVLILAYGVMVRRDSDTLRLGPLIALAGWIGEAGCIYLYHFYQYPDTWWLRIAGVPILVVLIWPMVILTGREVVRAIRPQSVMTEPLWVGVVVFLDASMVEVVAVAGGLWSWNEPGYLGVPLIGVLGWAYFAVLVDWVLRQDQQWQPLLLILGVPVALHGLLLCTWWGLFRWVLRGDWFLIYGLAVLFATWVAISARSKARMPFSVGLVRMLAATIFIPLLIFTAPYAWRVWFHVALLAVPYLLLTDFTRKHSPASPL